MEGIADLTCNWRRRHYCPEKSDRRNHTGCKSKWPTLRIIQAERSFNQAAVHRSMASMLSRSARAPWWACVSGWSSADWPLPLTLGAASPGHPIAPLVLALCKIRHFSA